MEKFTSGSASLMIVAILNEPLCCLEVEKCIVINNLKIHSAKQFFNNTLRIY